MSNLIGNVRDDQRLRAKKLLDVKAKIFRTNRLVNAANDDILSDNWQLFLDTWKIFLRDSVDPSGYYNNYLLNEYIKKVDLIIWSGNQIISDNSNSSKTNSQSVPIKTYASPTIKSNKNPLLVVGGVLAGLFVLVKLSNK